MCVLFLKFFFEIFCCEDKIYIYIYISKYVHLYILIWTLIILNTAPPIFFAYDVAIRVAHFPRGFLSLLKDTSRHFE